MNATYIIGMTTHEQVEAFHAANPTACIHDARAYAQTLPTGQRDDFLNHWHKLRFGIWLFPTNVDEMFPRMPAAGSAES